MSRYLSFALVLIVLLGLPADTHARSQLTTGPSWPPLPTPGYLPPAARGLLRNRMARHVDDTSQLLVAVVLLDRAAVREHAEEILSEPRLSRRSLDHDDLLNDRLPERFFVAQDLLRDRAAALRQAAEGTDDQAIASAFGKLAETCVACHSAYLAGR